MEELNDSSICQYVTFRLEDELFGVEVARTREILNLTSVTKVPQSPDYLLGVINLRGQVVPVIDMRLKLGTSVSETTQDTCVIVIEVDISGETVVVGALCDAVCEVLDIREDQIELPPRLGSGLKTEFIKGMGKIEETFLVLLDIDRVFNHDSLLQTEGDSSPTRKKVA